MLRPDAAAAAPSSAKAVPDVSGRSRWASHASHRPRLAGPSRVGPSPADEVDVPVVAGSATVGIVDVVVVGLVVPPAAAAMVVEAAVGTAAAAVGDGRWPVPWTDVA